MNDTRAFLRHTVATLAYRGGKATRGVSPEFAAYRAGPQTRAPVEILAHVGDLLDWALSIARGDERWHTSTPLPWNDEVLRFHEALGAFDACLASEEGPVAAAERLFQGPIADALTHVGQIAMLRRMAGEPMKGENYSRARIESGRVGPDQNPADPKREFD